MGVRRSWARFGFRAFATVGAYTYSQARAKFAGPNGYESAAGLIYTRANGRAT
jgi:hypothetical protein